MGIFSLGNLTQSGYGWTRNTNSNNEICVKNKSEFKYIKSDEEYRELGYVRPVVWITYNKK